MVDGRSYNLNYRKFQFTIFPYIKRLKYIKEGKTEGKKVRK